jgi:hypothetical protein
MATKLPVGMTRVISARAFILRGEETPGKGNRQITHQRSNAGDWGVF